MLKLDSINPAIAMLKLIEADILSYTDRIKSGGTTPNTGLLRIKAMECREVVYKRLEETYMETITIEKVLQDLQR